MTDREFNILSQFDGMGSLDYLMDFSWGGEQLPSVDVEKAIKGPPDLLPLDGENEISDEVSSHNEDGDESSHDLEVGPRPKKVKTEAERRKASRDRNREHARNTRLRKKAYMDSLRQKLQTLTEEREKTEQAIKASMSRVVEQQELRKQVVQNFFLYRARGDVDRRNWSTLVDEAFLLRMPMTPYRYFPVADVVNNERFVQGIDGLIRDTASLAVLFSTISQSYRDKVAMHFVLDPESVIIVGDVLMARWMLKSENATRCGAQCELQVYGMMEATFTSENKLATVSLVFDVMGFMQQLRRAAAKSQFQTTPSCLQMAEEVCDEPRIIVSPQPPFRVLRVNNAWSKAFGVDPSEYQLKTMTVERAAGGRRDANDPGMAAVSSLYDSLGRQLPCSIPVQYFVAGGRRVIGLLALFPLVQSGQLSHYLAVLEPYRDSSATVGPVEVPALLSFR